MNDGYMWWLVIVGVVIGVALVGLMSIRLPRQEDDVSEDERVTEAGWISRTIEEWGGIAPAPLVEEVLELHQAYLGTAPVPGPPAEEPGAYSGDDRPDDGGGASWADTGDDRMTATTAERFGLAPPAQASGPERYAPPTERYVPPTERYAGPTEWYGTASAAQAPGPAARVPGPATQVSAPASLDPSTARVPPASTDRYAPPPPGQASPPPPGQASPSPASPRLYATQPPTVPQERRPRGQGTGRP
jgi:hypothetical protein